MASYGVFLNKALLLGILFQAGVLVMRHHFAQRAVGFMIVTAYFSLCIVLQKHDGQSGADLAALSASFIIWGILFDLSRGWALTLAAANALVNVAISLSPAVPST